MPTLLLAAVELEMLRSAVPLPAAARNPTDAFPYAALLVTETLLLLPAVIPLLFSSKRELLMDTVVRAVDCTETPTPPLLLMTVSVTKTFPPAVAISMPLVVKPKMSQLSTLRALPARKRIPLMPVPMPLMRRLRRMTVSLGPACTTIPLVPLTRTEATWPPRPSISPPAAVLEIAPANVLHGAVRLQGLASSPTPETQVLLAWALMNAVPNRTTANTFNTFILLIFFFLSVSSLDETHGSANNPWVTLVLGCYVSGSTRNFVSGRIRDP